MKKLYLSMLAASSIISAPLAMAEAAATTGYTTSLQQLTSAAPKTAMLADYATKILVTNSSRTAIQVKFPGKNDPDYLHTNTHDYITHRTARNDVYVVLLNPYGNQFWAGNVCNHAIINVHNQEGSTSNYTTDVDTFCR